jgi:hypothetical protein
MSTRTAKDNSFHQGRYASSPEFDRGLIANLVAKRCEMLDDKTERELIWFVQYLSHQPSGIAAVAAEVVARFSDRLGTATMAKSRKAVYQSEEVKKIRLELPNLLRSRFPLHGETRDDISRECGQTSVQFPYSHRKILAEYAEEAMYRAGMIEDGCLDALAKQDALEIEKAGSQPASYPATAIIGLCREAAVNGFDDENDTDNLEKELCRLCLDPGWNLTAAAPWYFADLVNVLREYQQQWIAENSGAFVTALGQKVCATLEYTLHSRSVALLEGNARLGKSFAARAWCLQHPGLARFVEVPPGNDDTSFFRALARGLGLGNFLKYKTIDIRERVESVLLTGDLVLVLDEANRLWPEWNFRYAYPSRITWLMAMANAGVPICMVSTPQFIQSQKAAEKNGWNSAQLTGRIGHYEFLPVELSAADIIAVARAVLPEASKDVLQILADYASESSRYLAAVDSIAKRARYIAQINGRSDCSAADVRTAMKESVIPSDTMLVRTLEQAKKSPSNGRKLSPVPAAQIEIEMPPLRAARPVAPDFVRRGAALPELVQG